MTTKYYVVWKGRNPGVYDSWEECKAQTDGFPGATFKSFKTLFEAVNAWTEHITGSPMPERPELAPVKDAPTESLKDWKPDSEYPAETQEVLARIRGKQSS